MLSRLAPRLFIAAPQHLPRSARLFSSSSFPRAVPSDDPVDAHLGTPLTRLDDAFFRRNAFSTPGSEAVACQSGWLLANASKLKNKVVLITGVGGLDSLGGQLAVKLATKYGAKVVVSDSTEEGIVETVLEIHKAGGWATGLAINSNVWAEQLRLFNYTLRCFGQIDAVVSADASISDIPTFLLEKSLNMMGQLDPPRLGGLSSDLVGTALTAKLAFHHLCHSTSTDVTAFVSVGPAGSVRTASDPIVQPLHQAGAVSGTKISTVVTRFVNAMIPGPAETLKDVSVASIADVVDAIIGASTAQDGKKYVVDEVGVFTLPHQSNIGLGALEAGMSTSTESV